MTILAWGTTIAELYPGPNISSSVAVSTTSSTRISPNVSEGVLFPFTSPRYPDMPLEFVFSSGVSEGWVSWYNNWDTFGPQNDWPTMLIEGNGVELFRLDSVNGAQNIEYHNDTIWVSTGGSFMPEPDITYRMDFHFVIHDSTGVLEWYVDGLLRATAFFGDTLLRGESLATKVKFSGSGNTATRTTYLSAAFVSDTDSRVITYVQGEIDGAGAEVDWSGLFSDIDEVGVDDADLIQSGVTAEKATYTKVALPSAFNSGHDVVGLGVTARATKGSASPSNLQLIARENATNGFSGNKALGVFNAHQHMFTLNPDTASAWTFTEADDAEVGVQTIT